MKNYKSNCIKKEDYEFYTFPFKLTQIKNKRSFIKNQLEKNHPCFTENCCYDSGLRLRKGKLSMWVLVMERLKLSQYQVKKGKRLYVKELKGKPVFTVRKGFIGFVLILICVLIPVLAVINNLSAVEITDNDNYESFESAVISDEYYLDELFSMFLVNKVKVNSLTLENNQILLNVSNCNVENLLSLECYKENKMGFSEIIFEKPASGTTMLTYNLNEMGMYHPVNSQMFHDFTLYAKDHGAVIQREDFELQQLEMNIDIYEMEMFFSEAGNYMSSNGILFESLELNKSTDRMFMKADVCQGNDRVFMTYMLSKYSSVFRDNKKFVKPEISKGNITDLHEGNEVGRIIDKDGNQIIYYLSADGKIKEIR